MHYVNHKLRTPNLSSVMSHPHPLPSPARAGRTNAFVKALAKLFARRQNPCTALYDAIVRQARQPVFYTRLGICDSLDGRFDMIVLHVVLVCKALQAGRGAREAAQDLFDLFFQDMEQNLREMGAADIGVGKRIKKMARAFYGRAAAYGDALGNDTDTALAEALERNFFPREKAGPARLQAAPGNQNNAPQAQAACRELARYTRALAAVLDTADSAALLDGQIDWPTIE